MRSATVFRPPSPGGGGYQCSNAVPSHKQDLEWEMAGADLYTVALFVGGGVRIEGVLPRREGGLRSAHPSRRWIGGGDRVLPHHKGLQVGEGSELNARKPLLQADLRSGSGGASLRAWPRLQHRNDLVSVRKNSQSEKEMTVRPLLRANERNAIVLVREKISNSLMDLFLFFSQMNKNKLLPPS